VAFSVMQNLSFAQRAKSWITKGYVAVAGFSDNSEERRYLNMAGRRV
jgi:hypothetical protein